MFAELILSIVTGDSKILEGVLVAETTTSWPSVLSGTSSTTNAEEALETGTSCNLYPIEETTRVIGKGSLVVNLKSPLSSVKVPAPEPLTVIETAGTGIPDELFFTEPLMIVFWPKAAIDKIFAVNNATQRLNVFIIAIGLFGNY